MIFLSVFTSVFVAIDDVRKEEKAAKYMCVYLVVESNEPRNNKNSKR